ncbi:MAG: hypothetical protein HY894_08720 [Deltaproteobacteria bacterium]|nr:hypothetical protein [Deltaproteobacteria bacterium]
MAGGTAINITDTVANQGSTYLTSAASTVYYYLSTDAVITNKDVCIGYRPVAGIKGGTSSTATTVILVPQGITPGTYYIGAFADATNTNYETDETNNGLAGNQITVTREVDLQMTALTGPATMVSGATASFNNTVTNSGVSKVTTGTYVYFYLSADTAVGAGDVYLGRRYAGTLAGGAASSASTSLTIPANAAAGNWHVIAVADATNLNAETDETNNALSLPLTVTQ